MFKVKTEYKNSYKNFYLYAVWLAIAALSRIVPHIANTTPFMALVILAALQWSLRLSIGLSLSALLLSDVCLSYLYGYPFIGSWTFFNGSALVALVWLTRRFQSRLPHLYQLLAWGGICVFGHWLWTNLGTWLFSPLYPFSLSGLMTCYVAALPFLRNMLLGTLGSLLVVWIGIIKRRIKNAGYRTQ